MTQHSGQVFHFFILIYLLFYFFKSIFCLEFPTKDRAEIRKAYLNLVKTVFEILPPNFNPSLPSDFLFHANANISGVNKVILIFVINN